ncbi:MAG: hypothetical protein MZV70_64330 [Desulfobacterales bacterium]|nr:hypothetical protein [Desulfobacterales bacterium]
MSLASLGFWCSAPYRPSSAGASSTTSIGSLTAMFIYRGHAAGWPPALSSAGRRRLSRTALAPSRRGRRVSCGNAGCRGAMCPPEPLKALPFAGLYSLATSARSCSPSRPRQPPAAGGSYNHAVARSRDDSDRPGHPKSASRRR